jgi:hypothetical protein
VLVTPTRISVGNLPKTMALEDRRTVWDSRKQGVAMIRARGEMRQQTE